MRWSKFLTTCSFSLLVSSITYPEGNLSGLFLMAWLTTLVVTPYNSATSLSRITCVSLMTMILLSVFYNIFLMSHNFFFKSYSGTKKMQTSAKKACFQFAECSFSSAKIRLFLVTSKVLGKKYLKRGRRKRK